MGTSQVVEGWFEAPLSATYIFTVKVYAHLLGLEPWARFMIA